MFIRNISEEMIKSGFPRSLENSGKWPFHGKSGKSQGICQAPQGILENSKISGNSQGMSATSENITEFFISYEILSDILRSGTQICHSQKFPEILLFSKIP